MLYKWRLFLAMATLALASGCSATQESEFINARVVELSLKQKAQLEEVISNWFGGVNITLADSAFTMSSTLSIERKAHKDELGLPIEGRHANPAFTFTLLTQGKNCYLRNDMSGDIHRLTEFACVSAF